MNTEYILLAEGLILHKECVVCYTKFLNIKDAEYTQFLEKIKEKYKGTLPTDFENETTSYCYDDRFECLTCKNIVCIACICSMPDYKHGKTLNSYATFYNYVDNGDNGKEIYYYSDMEYTGIITCPICRKEDYRIFYTGKIRGILPEEILYDIKNRIK